MDPYTLISVVFLNSSVSNEPLDDNVTDTVATPAQANAA